MEMVLPAIVAEAVAAGLLGAGLAAGAAAGCWARAELGVNDKTQQTSSGAKLNQERLIGILLVDYWHAGFMSMSAAIIVALTPGNRRQGSLQTVVPGILARPECGLPLATA
jgi:hypothetical protein